MGRKRTGSVEERASSLRVLFTYNGAQQRETLYLEDGVPMLPTAPNRRHAQRLLAEVNRAIAAGTFRWIDFFPHSSKAERIQPGTVADLLDTFLAQAELKRSTLKTYRRMVDRFWKPQLGHMMVPAVRHSDITKALKAGGWASGKTRNNYLSMLSAAMELAVADEVIVKNPCATVGAAKWQKKPVDPFTQDEAEEILDLVRQRYDQQVWNFLEFWMYTGLRTGEIIALDWSKVDLRGGSLLIDQSFVVDQVEESTKTSAARTVLLNARAKAAITRQKAHTYLAGGPVFLDPGTGKSWAYEQNFRKRYWIPTLKALGIRYRRPYYCRSTYATICLMAGANPAFVARQLGHGLDVFFKDYALWIDGERDRSELEKIELRLGIIPELSPAAGGGEKSL